MIAVNENIKELYKSDSVPKQYQISVYRSNLGALFPADDLYPSDTLFPLAGGEADVVIENDRIVNESVSFRQSICDSGDIIFGKCNAAELVFKCADVNNLFVGDELLVRQYIGGEYVSMGAYYIASIQKSADRRFRVVTAYDRMTRFDINVADWYNGLWVGGTTSITLGTLRNSLCNYCGVPVRSASLVNDSMTVKKTMVPTEISGRDIIESICEINGVFGIIDNEGFFTFISLNTDEAVEEISIGIRKSLEHEDYTVSPINALVIRQESNDIGASVGEGDNPYIIQGNFLVYGKSSAELTTIATNVFNAISNITYVPVRLQCRGLPYIEPGDCIEIEMQDGSYIKTLVLSRSLSGVQSLTDDITASGSEKRVEIYGLSKSIIQIQGKANILERTVEQTVSRIEDLESGYSEIIQTADSISSRVESVEGQVTAIEQTLDGLTLTAVNGLSSSTITLKSGEITLASALITFSGVVTFDSLSTAGATTINGANITTGVIQSQNVEFGSSGMLAGMIISLDTGFILTPHTVIYGGTRDSTGFISSTNATITGTLNARAGVIGQDSMPWTIGGNTSRAWIYNGKSSFDNDTTSGIYIGTDGIAIGSLSQQGVVKIWPYGGCSMTGLNVQYIYFAGDLNYIYYDSFSQTLRMWAYNGFFVNNVRVGG
jgi:hypothetical protein